MTWTRVGAAFAGKLSEGRDGKQEARAGRQPDGIHVGAADEFFIGREPGVRNPILLDAIEDEAIDEVAAWNGRGPKLADPYERFAIK